MKSPIRYFGGKGNMYKKLLLFFPQEYNIYIEPFGGGATLLFQKKPSDVEIYNDLNLNVFSLFKVISNKDLFEKLKERLEITYF